MKILPIRPEVIYTGEEEESRIDEANKSKEKRLNMKMLKNIIDRLKLSDSDKKQITNAIKKEQ
jgi:hypothetical protein